MDLVNALITEISHYDDEQKIDAINRVKRELHRISPFCNEPVDCVVWVKSDRIQANDYNPNKVAPPEMELLEVSIINDGYTQPIVAFPYDDKIEVVDGFHRNRVGKESQIVKNRIKGYLPITEIRKEQSDKTNRIASTIRHNRARGKHQVDAMSEIVLELKNRNWRNERIARELGMDEEEILRLCQISGLQEMFLDEDFSKSWIASDSVVEYEPLTDEVIRDEINVKTVNTSDPQRVFHTFDKWECHKAGFYKSTPPEGMTPKQAEYAYSVFLKDLKKFERVLKKVTKEWKHSCEHYLTNSAMNRIAWLGQASVCYELAIPSKFCGGFNLLTEPEQIKANEVALKYLNRWLRKNKLDEVSYEDGLAIGRQIDIY